MSGKKLAIADKLTALNGEKSCGSSAVATADTQGLDSSNDRLAESVFGLYDYILRRCPGITMEVASAVAQASAPWLPHPSLQCYRYLASAPSTVWTARRPDTAGGGCG